MVGPLACGFSNYGMDFSVHSTLLKVFFCNDDKLMFCSSLFFCYGSSVNMGIESCVNMDIEF